MRDAENAGVDTARTQIQDPERIIKRDELPGQREVEENWPLADAGVDVDAASRQRERQMDEYLRGGDADASSGGDLSGYLQQTDQHEE